jgi:hypothetical protein
MRRFGFGFHYPPDRNFGGRSPEAYDWRIIPVFRARSVVQGTTQSRQGKAREQGKEPDGGYNIHDRGADPAEDEAGVKIADHDIGADFCSILGAVGRGKPLAGDVAILQTESCAVIESHAGGCDQHEVEGGRQAQIKMEAADSAEGAAQKHGWMQLKMKFNFNLC